MVLTTKTRPKVRHLAMALGIVLLWVPLELTVAYLAWSVHYENVAEARGMLSEADYEPEIERAAWNTVRLLVAAEVLVVVAGWSWARRRSTLNELADRPSAVGSLS
jgi:hypothetical protein